MKEPKEKKCIFCGGRLRKHGFQSYLAGEVVIRTQQYECVVCRKKSAHYVGRVIPAKKRRVIRSRVQSETQS